MKRILILLSLCALSACDSGVQHMGPTEYGVRFRNIPGFLGGGVAGASSVASPLETVVVFPWESIYRFDTSPQYLAWGKDVGGAGTAATNYYSVQNDDVHTRARDGNEAALKVTVRYRIKPDPESLVFLAQKVAADQSGVRDLVVSVVRSDIRTYMNRLRTSEFRDDTKRNDTVDAAREAAAKRLAPWGIDLEAINLKQYRFVRLAAEDKEDTRYQDRLREIQEMEQDIEGEKSRKETVRGQKAKELLQARSIYNARIAEANGYKVQATYEGDSYFAARSNEAKAILAEGQAMAEGMGQQIAALSGPGGQAMLKLEIAKQLSNSSAKYLTLNEAASGQQNIGVKRTDTNQLLEQMGIVEGLLPKADPKAAPSGQTAP